MNSFRLCAFADEADKMIDGQIAALRDNGIGLLEMRGVDGVSVAAISPQTAAKTAEKLKAAGISVWSIGSPVGKVKISEPAQAELDRFRRVLETAVICNAANIRLFSFYGTDDSSSCFDEICRRLDDMITAAKGSGVRLCHENEKGIYGDTAVKCAALLTALPELGGIYDPANFIQCGCDTLAAWELLRTRICYAHIKDATPDGRIVPPGYGSGHLRELIQGFAGAGVGVLTLEPHLKVFDGLSALEGESRSEVGKSGYVFKSGREAFDFATESFKALL